MMVATAKAAITAPMNTFAKINPEVKFINVVFESRFDQTDLMPTN